MYVVLANTYRTNVKRIFLGQSPIFRVLAHKGSINPATTKPRAYVQADTVSQHMSVRVVKLVEPVIDW